ncbi:MAG TPA: Flp family type IVb pilin [Allosphingosinicella sp.]|jgi:Flp pilus assembly pilin Flp
MRTFWKLLREERAATAIEYAMIAAFIAIAAIGAMVAASDGAIRMWNVVGDNVSANT